MRLKSKYRVKDNPESEIPADADHPIEDFDSFEEFERSLDSNSVSDIPEPPIAESVAEPVPQEIVEPTPEPEPEPVQAASDDDASAALKRQIEALRRSEEIQKAQAQQQRQPVPQIEPERLAWLRATPAAQQNYHLLPHLHAAVVQQGISDMSPEYFQAMEHGLAVMVEQQREQEQPQAEGDTMQETPKFFQPPPPPKMRGAPSAASRVSAPVSRSAPGSGSRLETNPRNVTLSALEREIAKGAGLTDMEYAQQKLRLLREKAEGLHTQGQ